MEGRPFAARLKLPLAILGVCILIYSGFSLLEDQGRNFHERGSWELRALSSFIIAAVLTVVCYRLALDKGAVIRICDDRLEHTRWKRPLRFQDIDTVLLERPPSGRGGVLVSLRLNSGAIQHFPTIVLPCAPTTFARRLKKALATCKSAQPPLS